MEDLEYSMHLNLQQGLWSFCRMVNKPYPKPLTFEEWRTAKHQLHPTRHDLDYKLLPEQIYLFPGNYDWWVLPEEDDDCDC